jgi:hypothetical protein
MRVAAMSWFAEPRSLGSVKTARNKTTTFIETFVTVRIDRKEAPEESNIGEKDRPESAQDGSGP